MTNPDTWLIHALATKVRDFVTQHVPPGRVALIDYPQHENVGDSAIWAGETKLLDHPHWPIAYVAERRFHNDAEMTSRLGNGTILLHGGGNLGDLWPRHQQFREEIVARHHSHRIVQLPQTVLFRDDRAKSLSGDLLSRHGDLVVAARDQQSYDMLRSMNLRAELVPDSAFCLGPMPRPRRVGERSRVLWLSRTDHESLVRAQSHENIVVTDWLRRPKPPLSDPGARALFHSTSFIHRCRNHGRGKVAVSAPLSICYNAAAHRRVLRGVRLLSSADVVVTDRLHGHILCLLLGIPHVLLPDRYGKLSSFWRTWTNSSQLGTWCDSPDDALAASLDLAGSGRIQLESSKS
jgi:pyruvyl transferase EpsO